MVSKKVEAPIKHYLKADCFLGTGMAAEELANQICKSQLRRQVSGRLRVISIIIRCTCAIPEGLQKGEKLGGLQGGEKGFRGTYLSSFLLKQKS